jgi:hypothetical protein
MTIERPRVLRQVACLASTLLVAATAVPAKAQSAAATGFNGVALWQDGSAAADRPRLC